MTVPARLFKLNWVTVVFSASTSLGLAVGHEVEQVSSWLLHSVCRAASSKCECWMIIGMRYKVEKCRS